MERTLILIKPDGVQRGLMGEILHRFERRGLRVVGMKFMWASRELTEEHYEEHKDRPFFGDLVSYLTSGPLVALVLEGKEGTIALARHTIGSTKPIESAPGTIRGDLAIEIGRNLVHGSANAKDAGREVNLWFSADELIDWSRDNERWISE